MFSANNVPEECNHRRCLFAVYALSTRPSKAKKMFEGIQPRVAYFTLKSPVILRYITEVKYKVLASVCNINGLCIPCLCNLHVITEPTLGSVLTMKKGYKGTVLYKYKHHSRCLSYKCVFSSYFCLCFMFCLYRIAGS